MSYVKRAKIRQRRVTMGQKTVMEDNMAKNRLLCKYNRAKNRPWCNTIGQKIDCDVIYNETKNRP